MSFRRSLFIGLSASALLGLPLLLRAPTPEPQRELVKVARFDPYATPLLHDYGRYREALQRDDHATLLELSRGDGHLAHLSALTLARAAALPPAARLGHYRRAAELRVDDPLARAEARAFALEMAAVAEVAGDVDAALAAYREALPAAAAVAALKRLQPDPYRRANAFFQARLHREALDALAGRAAPSIEAPAHRALGEYELARDAYERWLAEVPDDLDARYGLAWSHWYLGDLEAAEAAFRALPGASALYGRALVANRRGELSEAVRLLRATGDPARLWLATGLLEARERYAEALPLYLELARTASVYADDAAYRAWVLAERLGDAARAAEAVDLIPQGSFFALKFGRRPDVPRATAGVDSGTSSEAPEVLALARALVAVNEREAAVGELVLALQRASGEAETVAIAEALQNLGEFRASQRAAARLVAEGSRSPRAWKLAYPRAYPEAVEAHARAQDLEPELVWAVMRQESAFYPRALSRSNAQGLMQVIPSTWEWLAELQREEPADPFDVHANVRYGAFYLRYLLDYLGGDPELVVSAYNRGQGYIKRLYEGPVVQRDKDELYREIDALETREYLQRVVVNYEVYKALYGDEPTAQRTP